jgi:hypothetical protein
MPGTMALAAVEEEEEEEEEGEMAEEGRKELSETTGNIWMLMYIVILSAVQISKLGKSLFRTMRFKRISK